MLKNLNLKKAALSIAFILIFFVISRKISFHSLPKQNLQFFKVNIEESYNNGEYQLMLSNPINCPNRFFLTCEEKSVNDLLKEFSPVLLEAKTDTTIIIKGHGDLKNKIQINLKLGNPDIPLQSSTVIKSLPFPKDKSYELLQGNNSEPTHNSNLSRYAFDFTMMIGDTVTSTQNGYVIGVIDGYEGWGYSDNWKPYSNQVMIYDPLTHLFTMYGHLKQNSSMVAVGEFVTIGQPIALSGKTGQASEEHLHFNVLQADNSKSGLKSHPLDSIGNYKVNKLKRYQSMRN
jgi:hypothetical protein